MIIDAIKASKIFTNPLAISKHLKNYDSCDLIGKYDTAFMFVLTVSQKPSPY